MKLLQLFPEPIYVSKLERALTKEELETVDEYKKKSKLNIGNRASTDSYVLENKTLKNLKEDLNKKILDYFDKVICTDDPIIPYITQSWINYTEANQYHQCHFHPNSYVSGTFYISADKEVDLVKFFKPSRETIQPNIAKYNIFNAASWQFPVETGDVVLFQSHLEHGVDMKRGTNTRISLGFNVFFKGTIGNKEGIAELILK